MSKLLFFSAPRAATAQEQVRFETLKPVKWEKTNDGEIGGVYIYVNADKTLVAVDTPMILDNGHRRLGFFYNEPFLPEDRKILEHDYNLIKETVSEPNDDTTWRTTLPDLRCGDITGDNVPDCAVAFEWGIVVFQGKYISTTRSSKK